ncbi:MAG: acyltransferase [Marinobacterium sp.]|nr:acyltransferase [Marinobacterium sp.]
MEFRKDINGLRAIAVLSVVLFHFSASSMPGGFVGVDVFFVISGYLMTKIIFTGVGSGGFSLLGFYLNRAKRIIPALAVLCFFLLVFGWFFTGPEDYKRLGKYAASSVTFLSNFMLLRENGYFDTGAHEKWLLHTWSLSVEWQFYIIYPIVILVLSKFLSLSRLKVFILSTTIIGFFLNIYFTFDNPDAAYFLLHARAWEMLLGGVAFLYPVSVSDKQGRFMELVGLLLIVLSCFFISGALPWPGSLAILPTMGAFLIIQAARSEGVLGGVFFQKTGLYSYSIYLWHWPLVVLGSYMGWGEYWLFVGIPLSFLMGYISFHVVEKYSFKKPDLSVKSLVLYPPLVSVVIVGICGSIVYKTKGVFSHYPQVVQDVASENYNKNPYGCMTLEAASDGINPCYIGQKDNVKAVVLGDSHADAVTTAVFEALNKKHEGVLAITKEACPMLLHARSSINGDICRTENPERIAFVQENHEGIPVIVASRLHAYLSGVFNPGEEGVSAQPVIYFGDNDRADFDEVVEGVRKSLKETVCKLSEHNPVYLLRPIPEMEQKVPHTMAKGYLLEGEARIQSLSLADYQQKNQLMISMIDEVAAACGARVIDPAEPLCDSGVCISSLEGRPLYYDEDHLSEYGNRLLVPLFRQALLD